LDEYRAAFTRSEEPFLHYYAIQAGEARKHSLSRGAFWDLTCSAAAFLADRGISKGERIVHGFSANNPYDPIFRLASVMIGCVPVTINWQADQNERLIYKAKLTNARLLVYDEGFASRVAEIKADLPDLQFAEASKIEDYPADGLPAFSELSYEDEKFIAFTSGTTANPKGVSLSHRSYLANRLTFEQYFAITGEAALDLLLVNPLHHTNSSALIDWGMRRPGAVIHLVERYATPFWRILVEAESQKRGLFITSLVARHFDFLESLSLEAKLPVTETSLKKALGNTDILIGSAPVGPITVNHIRKWSGRLPHVRFGSTETCLEVMAIPISLPQEALFKAFQSGWSHRYNGEQAVGYYIGREHFPLTRVKIVKSLDPESPDYFRPGDLGEPGYIITQGPNVMSGYLANPESTRSVLGEGWYTGLRDIAFTLRNQYDGELDYYWLSRDSELLIRGGANYAYAQVAAELSKVLEEGFGLEPQQYGLAVVGLRLESEHEDSCCVTIELKPENLEIIRRLELDFLPLAAKKVSKGARPDHIRFAQIPLNFKGSIMYPRLAREFLGWLQPK
jgi:acyl-CoA synthetase (AMP-forming)/AMP-acid ligase II